MHTHTLADFRRQKDAWFKSSSDSPLPYGERAGFAGLSYYPENAELRLALRPEEFPEQQSITMTTSTGGTQDYLRWGQIHFTIDGQPATLTIYYAAWGDYFVPFVDATSGAETYGAGRYLDSALRITIRNLLYSHLMYSTCSPFSTLNRKEQA